MMGLFHKKEQKLNYDSEHMVPAIRSSICTGEKVAGFRNRETGAFTEIMLLRGQDDEEKFSRQYGITEDIPVFY